MKHTSHSHHPRTRAALATCALLLGATVAFAQSGSASSSSSSANPSRDSSAGMSGSRNSSSPSQAGSQSSTGGSDYGSASSANTPASDASTSAGAMTGRETPASATATGKLGFMDRRFVTKAADGGMAEVALAQLAAERASNPEVKNFAQQLVQDHTQVNSELMSLATRKNVKLDKDDGKDRTYKRLSGRSGADFDQEFVEHMIDEHEKDIKLFEKAAQDAKDAELRAFAAKHVDHLRHHLQIAQNLRASVVPTGRASKDASPSVEPNASSTSDRDSTYGSPSSSSSSSDAGAPTGSGSPAGQSGNDRKDGGR